MELSNKFARLVLLWTFLFSTLLLNSACTPSGGGETPGTVASHSENPQVEQVVSTPEEPAEPVAPSEEAEDFTPNLDLNRYLSISSLIGGNVDDYQNQNELLKARSLVNTDNVDTCNADKNRNSNDRFADQISFYTEMMMKATPSKVGIVGSYYGSPTNDANYFPTSLISHPLCISSSSSLSQTIKKVPSQAVIDKLNRFATKVNGLRELVMEGDSEAKAELLQTWTRLFSCLAYKESLSSADSNASRSVASANAPAGYIKPDGVEFYNDPAQDAASRLNIGLFQFTPNSSGNIKSCLKSWNEMHSNSLSCQVNESGSQAEMIKTVGSSLQSFNAFCGVHKVIQTFAIQVNTNSAGSTHPGNSGKVAANRCVTPHFYAGKAYNHFGPLQNSTGSNMNELYSCVENS